MNPLEKFHHDIGTVEAKLCYAFRDEGIEIVGVDRVEAAIDALIK